MRDHATLPRSPAAAALVLILAWLVAAAAPAGAQERADLYRVSDIAVDVTADTAAAAREQALVQAQREAFATVIKRITPSWHWSVTEETANGQIAELVRDIGISNERTSDVRYLADIEVRLARSAVHGFLRDREIRFSETRAEPVAVLPLFVGRQGRQLFDAGNPWLAAWQGLSLADGLKPLVLPEDRAAAAELVTPRAARQEQAGPIAELANRLDAAAGFVVTAEIVPTLDRAGDEVDVRIARVGDDLNWPTQWLTIAPREDEDLAGQLRRAAARAALTIADRWKAMTGVRFDAYAVVEAEMAVDGLADFVSTRQRLAEVAMIADLETLAVTPERVRLRLHYLGEREQLDLVLRRHGLHLRRTESDGWELVPSSGGPVADTSS